MSLRVLSAVFLFAFTGLGKSLFAQPVFTSTPPLTANEGQTYQFNIEVSDPLGQLILIDTPDSAPWPGWLEFTDPTEGSQIGLVADPSNFTFISAMAFDRNGNLYVVDEAEFMIFKVDTATGDVDPFAGTGIPGNTTSGPASMADISPSGIAVDTSGNVFFSSRTEHMVLMIDALGDLSLYAGTGAPGDGPNGAAISSQLKQPGALCFDAGDTLYISDNGNFKLKKVDPNGMLTHIAGNGSSGVGSNGISPLSSSFGMVGQIAVATNRQIFLPDTTNGSVRVVDLDADTIGWIPPGDPLIDGPSAVAFDWRGGIYITEAYDHLLRRVAGVILETISGTTGVPGNSGDGDAAGSALLDLPGSMITGLDGDLYLVSDSNRIRRIDLDYNLSGIPSPSDPPGLTAVSLFAKNGLDATQLDFSIHVNLSPVLEKDTFAIPENSPKGTAVDTVDFTDPNSDNLSFQFSSSSLHFSIDSGGIIRVDSAEIVDFEGTPFYDLIVMASDSLGLTDSESIRINLNNVPEASSFTSSDGVTTLEDQLFHYQITAGSEYLDFGLSASSLPAWVQSLSDFQRIADGSLATVLVGGATGGPPANSAQNLIGDFAILALFDGIQSVDVDSSGNTYLFNRSDNRIYRINRSTARLEHYGGNGNDINDGDGGLATSAGIDGIQKLTVSPAGDLYLAISEPDHIIRKITASNGIITTVAGNGVSGFSGDGGPATSASFNHPVAVALDPEGNLYVADQNNRRIRKVTASNGQISTIAGTGTQGLFGNGGPATQAHLALPSDLLVNPAGEIILADFTQLRRIDTNGIIDSVYHSTDEIMGIALDPQFNPVVSDGSTIKRMVDDSVELLLQAGFGSEDIIHDIANDPWGNLTYGRANSIFRSNRVLRIWGIPGQENVGKDTVVTVLDDPISQISQELVITVKNINDAPVGQDVVVSLAENSPTGTDVFTVIASDEDGDSLTFQLIKVTPVENFELDSSGTVLFTGDTLDYESIDQYVLTLLVQDPDQAEDEYYVTINITNVNEAPSFEPSTISSLLLENDTNGFSIDVLPIDEDGDDLSYQIISDGIDTVFAISATDSSVQFTPLDSLGLNFEALADPSFNFFIIAVDPGGLADSLEIALTVIDVNEVPVISDTIPDQSAIVGKLFGYSIDRDWIDDPDDGPILFPSVQILVLDSSSAPLKNPTWLFWQGTTLTLSGTPTEADRGIIHIEFRVADLEGLFAADTFALSIQTDTTSTEPMDTITGVEHLTGASIRVFPNPTSSLLNIELDNPGWSGDSWAVVMDIYGNRLVSSPFRKWGNQLHLELDVHYLRNGLYLLFIGQDNQLFYQGKIKKE